MLTIQDVGLSIMGDAPKHLYFLGGPEFGIKEKYIDFLVEKIGDRLEANSILDIISLMNTKRIVPLTPRVYVIRYDKIFISKLNQSIFDTVSRAKICGVIVGIYQSDSDINKLDKYFPDNTAIIDHIAPKHLINYLRKDFPSLDASIISDVVKISTDYFHAKNMCRCLAYAHNSSKLSITDLMRIFGISQTCSDNQLIEAIASRNFNQIIYISDHYEGGDKNYILYQFLNCMIELDKILDNKYSGSDIKKYIRNWTRSDIYYMFNHVYNCFQQLRSGASSDIDLYIVYLSALLRFKNIPSTEVLL